MSRSRRLPGAQPGWAVPGVVVLGALVGICRGTGWQPGITVTMVSQTAMPIVFTAVSARRTLRERNLDWVLITCFAVATAVAQIGWTATGYVSGPTSEGSVWDLVYLAGIPLGLTGWIRLSFRGLGPGRRLRIVSEALVTTVALAIPLWILVFGVTPAGDPAHLTIDVLFPLLDVLTAALILTCAIYQPGRWPLRWLAAAAMLGAVSDALVVAAGPVRGTPPVAILVCWAVAPFLLVAMAVSPDAITGSYAVTAARRNGLNVLIAAAALAAVASIVREGTLAVEVSWLLAVLITAFACNQALVFAEIRRLSASHDAAMTALRSSEARFRVAFDGAPVGIAVIEDGIVREINPTVCRLTGLPAEVIVGHNVRDFIPLTEIPQTGPEDWLPLGGDVEGFVREARFGRPDGSEVWMSISVARQHQGEGRSIAIIEDITDRRAATEHLAHLAIHDQLTGLPNRAAFLGQLETHLQAGRRVAVAFLDLDRFKVVNDSLGHAVGDRLLTDVADRLRTAVANDGVVARFAGDEFTVLFVNPHHDLVDEVVRRIRGELARPVPLDPNVVTYPVASLGVAFSTPGIDAEQMMARADAAMYRAKARGRNAVEYDLGKGASEASNELRVVNDLHRAIERDELRLHFQAVVDLESGHTVGHEALVRWDHPDQGLLGPGSFIEVAEQSGLIVPLGDWVLHAALRQHREWADRWPGRRLSMSVNMAADQLSDAFVDKVAGALHDTSVDPQTVWLELTESTLMTDIPTAQRVLGALRALGVRITVDDFGTGYSSLSYLQRFPVEGLKVDRSFVARIDESRPDQAICEAVVSLGEAMSLRVVAEGIETRRQLDRLRAMGCPFGQGFFFGRPQPAPEVESILRAV